MSEQFTCRLCNSALDSSPSFVLNNLPLGVQYFPSEYDLSDDNPVTLDIFRCTTCGFVQTFGNQVVYKGENSAATSVSPAMVKHKVDQAENFVNKYNLKGKRIFEAGCGDGHFLKMLTDAGASLSIGVEPSLASKENSAYKNDVVIHTDYITKSNVLAEAPFDAFATFHVMEHIPDIHDFIDGIYANLKEEGIGLVEVPSSELIEAELRFYDIINDHLNYFTLRTLRLAFEMHDFEILESYRDWNGEHDILIVKKRKSFDYNVLEKAKNDTVSNLLNALNNVSDNAAAIWGASMHSLTLLSQLNTNKIRYVIDSAPYKQNKFTPVSHFPIVAPEELSANPVELIIIVAPRFAEEIVENLKNNTSYSGKIALLDREKVILIR